MKLINFIFLAPLLVILNLSACAHNQNMDGNTLGTSTSNQQQDINDTNYQNMMREQSTRVQAVEAEVPHVGRR